MRQSRAALAAILSVCAIAAMPLAAGQAQTPRPLTLSREERTTLTALQAAAAGPDVGSPGTELEFAL